jgi:hypothetical protein
MKNRILLLFMLAVSAASAQNNDSVPDKTALKFNISRDGSRYFQVTFLNQVWLRWNESNSGTVRFSQPAPSTFDIGLRRTRIQMFGQITDRAFIYFQFGQNNFNNAYNLSSNRKYAAFFHDAVCEYRVSRGNQLKVGAGLTVLNGLSRFSQPSVGTIMTLDVPVFLQTTVDQTDQFDRRPSVYVRGQLGRLDYRLYLADPFPVNSNGATAPAISVNSSFVNAASATNGFEKQYGGYLSFNLLEKESHITPYMAGTYLGKKRIWNVAVGSIYQKNATWRLKADGVDTAYSDMLHVGVETFVDMPVHGAASAVNICAAYYYTGYGKNYMRYNGIMNPATGSSATSLVQPAAYGNAFPMFGTGTVAYFQAGALFKTGKTGLMPFISGEFADYEALQHKGMLVCDAGVSWLISGHSAKLSLDYQNRPQFTLQEGIVRENARRSCIILQYQISF